MKKTAHTIQASRDPFEGSEKDIVIDCGAIPGCGIQTFMVGRSLKVVSSTLCVIFRDQVKKTSGSIYSFLFLTTPLWSVVCHPIIGIYTAATRTTFGTY